MSVEFERHINLGLLFSQDLKKIILRKNNGKLDGLITIQKRSGFGGLEMTKFVKNELLAKIAPTKWAIVISLPHIDKIWKMRVYRAIYDFSKLRVDENNYQICELKNLPDNCFPNLYWLIPMSLDMSILSSGYNQILVRE